MLGVIAERVADQSIDPWSRDAEVVPLSLVAQVVGPTGRTSRPPSAPSARWPPSSSAPAPGSGRTLVLSFGGGPIGPWPNDRTVVSGGGRGGSGGGRRRWRGGRATSMTWSSGPAMRPTVTRRWSSSGRTRNGSPGATPMPRAASATTAERSSATSIHRLMPSAPLTPTSPSASTPDTSARRRAYAARAWPSPRASPGRAAARAAAPGGSGSTSPARAAGGWRPPAPRRRRRRRRPGAGRARGSWSSCGCARCARAASGRGSPAGRCRCRWRGRPR